jgi:hypothetical protein
MGLEAATYIEDLVGTNPTGTDDKNQGDNHLRLIKDVLQNQFPSLGGVAVSVAAAKLNYLSGVTSSVQDQIDTKSPKSSPTFTGTLTVPTLTVTGNSTVVGNVTANNLGEINYYTADGANSLLTGSNLLGDTALELAAVRISGVRVGNAITLAGRVDISGFSVTAPNDSSITIYLNITAALAEVGIVSFGANDTGTGTYLLQSSGFDFGMEPLEVTTFGTNQLRFLSRQVNARRSPSSFDVQSATSMELNFTVVIPNCSE